MLTLATHQKDILFNLFIVKHFNLKNYGRKKLQGREIRVRIIR